jgi:hypothetical protein
MNAQFLTLRLTEDDVDIVTRLRAQTGLSKSDLVKRALREMVSANDTPTTSVSLYDLKMAQTTEILGDSTRQSAHIKQIVRERLQAKHSRA